MDGKMKYVIIVGDGMADEPIEELGRKTPLMVAKTPTMDWMAQHGELGLVRTVPEGLPPGSEIANLSIMGYDPALTFTGRGPIEAVSLGVSLGATDIAFRCNLVTLDLRNGNTVMEDFSAGHIKDDEARQIILELNQALGDHEFQFYPGVSYRHLLIWKAGAEKFPSLEKLPLTPPHDILGQEIFSYLPGRSQTVDKGPEQELLRLMTRSQAFLKIHPVNVRRLEQGLLPANSIWLWGQGKTPKMATLKERFGMDGYVISAVPLIKGIGIFAGLGVLEVPGATGYFDTNYDGKAQYALNALRDKDLVYVHVEAPDEAGHMGDLKLKIESIEAFDDKIVGPILNGLTRYDRYRVLVMPDHPTPIRIRTHTAEPIPYVIYSSEGATEHPEVEGFNEVTAERTGIRMERGFQLIERLFSPHAGREKKVGKF